MKKESEQNNLHNVAITIKGIKSRSLSINYLSFQMPWVVVVIIAIGCGSHMMTPDMVHLIESVFIVRSVR